ncbi:lysophospholipid acyltransferase family protein [soil metagenome]
MPSSTIGGYIDTLAGRAVIRAIVRYFSATFVGSENVPRTGGALLVGNHGVFGFDAFVLGALLARDIGRMPTWLADRHLWLTPGFGPALDFAGAIKGERPSAVARLQAGDLVVVYPGGIFDSYKLARDRHRLKWGNRAGFARVAMMARVPIVPIAACGVDDMYRVVAREPGLGNLLFGDARYNFPIALGRLGTPIPKKVPVTIHALSAVDTSGDASKPEDVERVRALTYRALQTTLDES